MNHVVHHIQVLIHIHLVDNLLYEQIYELVMKMMDIVNNRIISVVQKRFLIDGSFSRRSAKRLKIFGTKSSYANNISIKIPINNRLITKYTMKLNQDSGSMINEMMTIKSQITEKQNRFERNTR